MKGLVGAIKSASARFSDAFWRGFAEARAEARARTQPAPDLAAAFAAYFASETYKAALAGVVQGAFADGVAAEKARIEAILRAPGAATFREIAMDLVLGPASSAQAVGVLARAEADAATRAGSIKSDLLERASSDQPTIH